MARSTANPLPPVAAHLIVGSREEPFLAAMLESIAGACSLLIVNDNSPDPSPHEATLRESRFGREGRLAVDRAPFADFAQARNVCLRIHRERAAGDWAAFVDADEVHGGSIDRIARNLVRVPAGTGAVEGYTWHFFASPDWYMSIERRMSFFRVTPNLRWEGAVHERLAGFEGARLILPYVYAHYGWVMGVRNHAQKGRQYSSLGAPGRILSEPELDEADVENYFEFAHRWRSALRFRAAHPPAAQPVVARLKAERAQEFALIDRLVRDRQSPAQRAQNALMMLNYEQRWRLRSLNPQARRMLAR